MKTILFLLIGLSAINLIGQPTFEITTNAFPSGRTIAKGAASFQMNLASTNWPPRSVKCAIRVDASTDNGRTWLPIAKFTSPTNGPVTVTIPQTNFVRQVRGKYVPINDL